MTDPSGQARSSRRPRTPAPGYISRDDHFSAFGLHFLASGNHLSVSRLHLPISTLHFPVSGLQFQFFTLHFHISGVIFVRDFHGILDFVMISENHRNAYI